MGMTEQQLKEIAVCEMRTLGYTGRFDEGFQLIKRFLAALPKPEPVGYADRWAIESIGTAEPGWEWIGVRKDNVPGYVAIYTKPVIATPVVEQTNTGHEDTERLNHLIKSGRIVLEVNGEYFTYNHTSGRSGPSMATPRAAIDASMDEKGGA